MADIQFGTQRLGSDTHISAHVVSANGAQRIVHDILLREWEATDAVKTRRGHKCLG